MQAPLDNLFENLSTDPHLASFELLQRVDKHILAGQPSEVEYSTACGVLEAFYEMNSWKVPDRIVPSSGGVWPGGKDETVDAAVQKARAYWRLQYEGYHSQIMNNNKFARKRAAKTALEAATAKTFGYAILDPEEKKQLHEHIDKIRSIIDKSKLDDRKKNSLFEHLSALGLEVNRNGTRTDRFFAFATEVGFCLGDFGKNAKPLFDEVSNLVRVVTGARARHEGLKLPPGEEMLSLPRPSSEQDEDND
jgi:hypothetical protein